MSKKIIWTGKTEVEPNFWGLNRPNQGLGISMSSQSSGHNEPASPLGALFLLSVVYAPFFMIGFNNRFDLFIFTILYWAVPFYLFFLREIKYYQLAKKTIYEITENEIIFHHNFLSLKRKQIFPFSNIRLFHLVEYHVDGIEKGSIFIYTKTKVKTYDIRDRERNSIPKIEMIREYNEVYKTLLFLHKVLNTTH